jgi:hypothetical protein
LRPVNSRTSKLVVLPLHVVELFRTAFFLGLARYRTKQVGTLTNYSKTTLQFSFVARHGQEMSKDSFPVCSIMDVKRNGSLKEMILELPFCIRTEEQSLIAFLEVRRGEIFDTTCRFWFVGINCSSCLGGEGRLLGRGRMILRNIS